MTVNVDNIRAIFLANNKNASDRTKHVDVRYHFVREMIDNGFLKVTFVKSDANVADIFTKNLEAKKYELFQKMLQVHPKHFKKEGY